MICDVVNAGGFIQLSLHIIAVSLILHGELHLGEIPFAVGEQLRQFQTIGEDPGVILQGIIGILGGAFPCQHHLVGVAVVAVDHIGAAVHGCGIGDPQGAIRIAGVDHGCVGIHRRVHFLQAVRRHFNGHSGLAGIRGTVGNGKLSVRFRPSGNGIGAGRVRKEFQHHIVFVVGDTFAQGVGKGVAGQIGRCGGNTGQCADDLIVNTVPVRSRAGVRIAVGDAAAAVMLAGIVLALPQGLVQRRITGQVLWVHSHIINPAAAAGRHGQADEEGITGTGDHFRHSGFHHEIQSQLQIFSFGFAVSIGQGHGSAALSDVGFQSVLHCGSIGFQRGTQGRNKDIGLVVVFGIVQLVRTIRLFITVGAVSQSQCVQEVCSRGLADAVEGLHMVRVRTVRRRPRKLNNIRDPEIGKFHILQGIAVEGIIHVLVVDSSRHVAGVPCAVLLGVGQIHLVDGQGAFGGGIHAGIFRLSGGNAGGEAKKQRQGENQGDHFGKLFH